MIVSFHILWCGLLVCGCGSYCIKGSNDLVKNSEALQSLLIGSRLLVEVLE